MGISQQTKIIERVSRWKHHFNDAIAQQGGISSSDSSQLSYIQILKQAETGLSPTWLNLTISSGLNTIGSFSREEQKVLHTPGYHQAVRMAGKIFNAYSFFNFSAQTDTDGPVIVMPKIGMGVPPLGIIFHVVGEPKVSCVYPPEFDKLDYDQSSCIQALEIFYESDIEGMSTLPDTFALLYNNFVTIKAVNSLSDDLRLQKRMLELGLV